MIDEQAIALPAASRRVGFEHAEWRQLRWMTASVAGLHLLGWGLLLSGSITHPELLGLGTLAYTLGLRHAFDADHIAAIDNTTRKLRQEGRRPLDVGFFFSLGHSTVVLLLIAGLAVSASAARSALPGLGHWGGIVGTGVGASFLFAIGVLNLVVLIDLIGVKRAMSMGVFEQERLERLLEQRGLLARLGLRRLTGMVTRGRHMFGVGFVFGLGFDTASEVALLALGGSEAGRGLPFVDVLALPLLFAAGMSMLDTADGVLMARAYGWTLERPVRRLYCNITITFLSVAVALLIGAIELVQLLAAELHLHGTPWTWLDGLDFQTLGYVVVGLFVLTWGVSLALWHLLAPEQSWGHGDGGHGDGGHVSSDGSGDDGDHLSSGGGRPSGEDGGGAPGARRAIVLITTADTEILAAARALECLPDDFPAVRCANPAQSQDAGVLLDELLVGARVVLVRLLGGRRAWPDGLYMLRARCVAAGVPLIALGGEAEADAELAALSTAPAGAVAQAFEYLRHGGVQNTEQLLRFLADTFLLEGHGFTEPVVLEDHGCYVPGSGDVPLEQALHALEHSRPVIATVFYRSHRVTGNTAFIDTLAEAITAAGGQPLCVWCYSLRPDEDGGIAALEPLSGRIDALITTVLASGGSHAGDAPLALGADGVDGFGEWNADALAKLDVPVIQAICATVSREHWVSSDAGLTPLDAAMQVAIPEFDGRIVGGVLSFKECDERDSPVGAPLTRYVADPERAKRVAELAVRHARLRLIPPAERRLAVVLSSFPTKHSRIGNAVGLDTPASAVEILRALGQAGYAIDGVPDSSDELIHALIAAGGHDPEFLTDEQLAGAQARLPADAYRQWFEDLPRELRESVSDTWGPPPGTVYVDGEEIVIAGLRLGNVFLAIQPPRGYGENPVAIYHDPKLAPSHHYLAAYWWIERVFGADAIVHLGKHGTLEWLPGKGLGLSASCAPDAALCSVPLFYPFIVNDPGEGTQAKRRAHAVVVDHLVPPMMRAETYDELAELETLLDEYARVETLDPSKLPALAARIWELLHAAQLHRDLDIDDALQPSSDQFGELIRHIDGYLCEIKDLQVRDGLHVLGCAPEGEQLRGLITAILRLGSGEVPGLRRAIAAAYGLDEPSLAERAGRPAPAQPVGLLARFPGPSATGGDLIDRLDEAQRALIEALEQRDYDPLTAGEVCRAVLGIADPGIERTLCFAAREVVPRVRGSEDEIRHLLDGLDGRFIPAGPSGSPTRGRVDVLPTGRNFYSVDPKSIPSPLACEVGGRLARDLLERHVEEDGRPPETVGIVVWGTAAMRTHGDDIGEILALLGVRPTWNPETRRIVGLEVVSLETLGRPRIDVTVRISGFFRDAFPNLIALIDEAVTTVAALEEPPERNFVRKHALADQERLAPQLGDEPAWRRATTRIFGSAPGAYGAGLLQLIDARNWREDADLAEVYEAWGGYAYGKGLHGAPAREAMRDSFARIEVAVKNVDNREHDLFDSDDYFQYHGGMIATVRALTGADPKAYIGDSADPDAVRNRSLREESHRVFRSRVANPRWIASMIRHGYKGAFELSATVDYLFGYDATAGVVEDWMYEALASKYVLDPDVAAFMARSNPWALRAIGERLLEAADRGLWEQPLPSTLAALRDVYLQIEGELEEGERARA